MPSANYARMARLIARLHHPLNSVQSPLLCRSDRVDPLNSYNKLHRQLKNLFFIYFSHQNMTLLIIYAIKCMNDREY